MKIMHIMANEAIAQRPKRRYYSPELKGQIVAECQISGASVAGVALAHGINANIVHRWRPAPTAPLAGARAERNAMCRGLRISGFLDIKFDTVDTVFGTAVSELL